MKNHYIFIIFFFLVTSCSRYYSSSGDFLYKSEKLQRNLEDSTLSENKRAEIEDELIDINKAYSQKKDREENALRKLTDAEIDKIELFVKYRDHTQEDEFFSQHKFVIADKDSILIFLSGLSEVHPRGATLCIYEGEMLFYKGRKRYKKASYLARGCRQFILKQGLRNYYYELSDNNLNILQHYATILQNEIGSFDSGYVMSLPKDYPIPITEDSTTIK